MAQKQENLTRIQIITMMATLLLGSFVTTLAETLLNNGLTMIMEENHVSQATAQWLSTGYMLAAGIVMPMAAYFMHTFSLRKIFMFNMSTFLVGSVVAATAPNFTILLIGRLIQGIAVGINMPLVENVLYVIFPPQQRGLAIGIAGIVINLGPAVGPTLSGFILEYYNWRMLFIVLIPITVLILLLTPFFVKDVIDLQHTSLDWLSVLLAVIGLGSLLYSMGMIGENGQISIIIIIMTAVGLISVYFFIKRQIFLKEPLLDVKVFKVKSYRLGATIALLISAATMAPELMLPLFNQNILKVTPLVSGEMLIPSAVAMAVLSPLAGKMYDKFGIKKMAIFGAGIGLIMAIPMMGYTAQTPVMKITLLYCLRCAGLTLCYSPACVYALNSLAKEYVVHGNTLIVTMVQLTNAFATALAVTVQSCGEKLAVSNGANKMLAAINGYHWAFASTVLITLVALILIFRLKNKTKVEN